MLYHPQNILESQRCIYFAKAVNESGYEIWVMNFKRCLNNDVFKKFVWSGMRDSCQCPHVMLKSSFNHINNSGLKKRTCSVLFYTITSVHPDEGVTHCSVVSLLSSEKHAGHRTCITGHSGSDHHQWCWGKPSLKKIFWNFPLLKNTFYLNSRPLFETLK